MRRRLRSAFASCILCFLLALGHVSALAQQVQFPTLDRSDMQEDAEFLLRTLGETNPQLPLRKRLTGIDHLADARRVFETSVDTITGFGGFYYAVARMLFCMRDMHCRLTIPRSKAYYGERLSSQEVVALNRAYDELYTDYNFPGISGLYLRDGRLVSSDNLWIYLTPARVKDSSLFLPIGTSLDSVGGLPVFSPRIQDQNLLCRARWDTGQQKYYSPSLASLPFYHLPNTRVSLTLPSGKKQSYEKHYGGYRDGTCYEDGGDFSVQYDSEKALLYIRIPVMDYEEADSLLYPALREYRSRPIRKVVIDVRGNSGGSDNVWLDLMSLLLPEPVVIRAEGITTVANLTRHIPEVAEKKPDIERSTHPFLKDEPNICVFPFMLDTITRSPESLNVQAPIYLLVDEYSYSSALAFMSAARQIPGMKSVGQRSGWFGGMGMDPLQFVLPHSKIAFQVEPITEITGVKTEDDILQDRPDIELPLPVEEIGRHLGYMGKRYSIEYMRQHDSVFRHVLDL